MTALAEALRAEFTDTELHGLMIVAERGDNRDHDVLKRLRKAALDAIDCADCKATRW